MYPQWQILYIHNVLIDVTQTCYNILVFRGHLDLWGKKLILSAISVHVNSHVSVQIKKPSLFFNDRREGSQITCIHTCLVETIFESASQIFPTDGWRGGGGSLVRLNPELAICSFSWGRGCYIFLITLPSKYITGASQLLVITVVMRGSKKKFRGERVWGISMFAGGGGVWGLLFW